MANQHEHFLTAIDVGSAKTCALVAEITDSGLRYRGHGVAESRGSRKGVIVDLDKAVSSIQKAVEQAEDIAGAPDRACIARRCRGPRSRHQQSWRHLSFGTRAREIGRDEIRAGRRERPRYSASRRSRNSASAAAGIHSRRSDRSSRSAGHDGRTTRSARPHGDGGPSAMQNVITAVNQRRSSCRRHGFRASGLRRLRSAIDERELGVCLADMGAGSTGLIVFHEGAVAHTAVIPIGGDHFTSDLSVGLCTPVAEAEKIKKLYGNAIVTLIPEGNEVEVPSVGDRPSRLIPQRMVAEILEPRARELFEMMRDNLRHSGMFDLCVGGHGADRRRSRLPGIFDVAESVLRRSVRLSWPAPLAKMPSTLAEPEFATVWAWCSTATAHASPAAFRTTAGVRD